MRGVPDEASDKISLDPVKTEQMFLVAPQKGLKQIIITKQINVFKKHKKDNIYSSQRNKGKLVDW